MRCTICAVPDSRTRIICQAGHTSYLCQACCQCRTGTRCLWAGCRSTTDDPRQTRGSLHSIINAVPLNRREASQIPQGIFANGSSLDNGVDRASSSSDTLNLRNVQAAPFYEEGCQSLASLISGKELRTEVQGAPNTAVEPKSDTFRVHVSNIDFEITESELTAHFAKAGPMESVQLARRKTGSSNGWAHVEYSSYVAAASAVECMSGTELGRHGRCIKVKIDGGGMKKAKPDALLELQCRACLSRCASLIRVEILQAKESTFFLCDLSQLKNCSTPIIDPILQQITCKACGCDLGYVRQAGQAHRAHFRAEDVALAL